MRKLFLKSILLLCALIVGTGNAWGTDPVTVTLTQTNLGLDGSYSSNATKTIDGITFKHTDLMKNNSNIQAKASSGVIYNTTAFPGVISSVAITHSGTARATTIHGSADGSTWSQVSTGSGSITGDFSAGNYRYFKITRGSNAAYWTKIEITYIPDPKYAITFSDPTGGTIVVKDGETPISSGDKFVAGKSLNIVATPAANYNFTSWSAESGTIGSATTATTTFTMGAADVVISAIFTPDEIISDVELDNVTNGSIAASIGESPISQANLGQIITITATPNAGYALKNWSVLDNNLEEVSVTLTGANTATFVMPATSVIVSAEFDLARTITYYVAGSERSIIRADGTTLNLDEPSAIYEMPFVGWSSTNSVESPSFVENTSIVSTDMTLYAIFTAQVGSVTYNLVESDLGSAWAGDYLIAYDSNTFADGRTGGTDGLGKLNQKVNPGSKLSGKIVDGAWGDIYKVTLEETASGSKKYVLLTQDGKYNYQTSNTNGLAVTTTKSTAANYPITALYYDEGDIRLSLGGNANGAVFRYNTGGYFRYYKDCGQSAVYLYKRIEIPTIYSLGLTESVTISSAGWATFSSTNALDFTNVDGVEAYLVGGVTGSTLNLSDAQGKVPAGTGLLLNGEAGSYDIPVIASASPVGTNKLVACTSETVLPVNADHYVLVNDGGAVFQNLSEHGATIHAGKAYLNLSGAAAPSIIRFVEENNNATDIQSVEEIDKAVKFIENGQLLIKRGNIIYDAMGRVIR